MGHPTAPSSKEMTYWVYIGYLVVLSINVTFDGDQITVRIILVKVVAEAMKDLSVRTAALDITQEGKFSHIVAVNQPTIMCWANYLRGIDKGHKRGDPIDYE